MLVSLFQAVQNNVETDALIDKLMLLLMFYQNVSDTLIKPNHTRCTLRRSSLFHERMIAYNCNPFFFSFFYLSFLFCFSFWTVPLKRFLFVYKTFCLRETLEVSGLDY